MASAYIVWNSTDKRFEKGPFPSSADAQSYIDNRVKKKQSRANDKSPVTYTVETVTV